jgi:hypothetical protein
MSVRNLIVGVLATLMLAAPGLAQPGPGEGPDPDLDAIEPETERVSVGLAGEFPADIARYLLANGVQGASLSPTGEYAAAASLITGVRQLWIVPAPGGQPARLRSATALPSGAGRRTGAV